MAETTENERGTVLDLQEIALQAWHRWYMVLITIALSLLISLIYTKLFVTPTYRSTAKIIVFNADSSQVTSSDITVATYLAKDYVEVITDRTVLEEVIKNLKLKQSYGSLRSKIAIENPKNTRILEISVTTPDPKQSKRIADEVCYVSQRKIVELLNIDQVNIMGEANLPTSPADPSLSRNLMVAFWIGLAVSAGVVLLFSVFDDKIKDDKDVEKYLEMSVLGQIPYARGRSADYQNKYKRGTAARSRS